MNGLLLITLMDNVTDVLSNSRTRFLGTYSIQLAKDSLSAVFEIDSHYNKIYILKLTIE